MSRTHVDGLCVLPLAVERDGFELRRRGQLVCRALGLEGHELVRVVTVLSEVGRDLLGAPGLQVDLHVASPLREPELFRARFTWSGPRVPGREALAAAERLLDHCAYEASSEGHALTAGQRLPASQEGPGQRAERARAALRDSGDLSMAEELRTQNRQLLRALEESRAQQEELQRLNAELEETNQGVVALYSELSAELEETNTGVVALYAELEDKTRQLRLASEAKTRFWANVSHELRAPVNSVIALARLLLAPGADPLTEEQRQQMSLIAGSGSTLLAWSKSSWTWPRPSRGASNPIWSPPIRGPCCTSCAGRCGAWPATGCGSTSPTSRTCRSWSPTRSCSPGSCATCCPTA